MQSVAQIFVRRTTNEIEKRTRSFSEKTMKSRRENGV